MKIVITGGTGFIGKKIVDRLLSLHHHVIILSRQAGKILTHDKLEFIEWDFKNNVEWKKCIDGSDVVLNFAGESLAAKRWTQKQKEKIIASRVDSTQTLVHAMKEAKQKPSVFINASAVGYYGSIAEDIEVTELFKNGNDFLASVCKLWEEEALRANDYNVRTILLRQGVVLGRNDGALKKMLLPFKLFIGGPLGSGKQWFPWIHIDDVMNIILFSIDNKNISGAINVTAPQSFTMKQFCSALGKAMHRPSWATVPSFVLKILLGEMSNMILTGQKVIPKKLLESGFQFRYPKLKDALENIFKNE